MSFAAAKESAMADERRQGKRRESPGRREHDIAQDALGPGDDEAMSLLLKVMEDARSRDRAEHDRRLDKLESCVDELKLYAARQRALGTLAGAVGGMVSSAGLWALVRWLTGA